MDKRRLWRSISLLGLLQSLIFFSAQSFAASSTEINNINAADAAGLPNNLIDAGWPHFDLRPNIKITQTKSGTTLTATLATTSGFKFQFDPSTTYNVINGPGSANKAAFNLTAKWNSSGAFLGGNFNIKGEVDNYPGTDPYGLLFSASIPSGASNWDLDNYGSGKVLGFNTNNFGGWAAQFGTAESLYLFTLPNTLGILDKIFGPWTGVSRSYAVSGTNIRAVTTVPLPAAAWLLGSGLVALFGMRRKNLSAMNATMPA